MSCKYCNGGRIAVEPGSSTSYPCPDCRKREEEAAIEPEYCQECLAANVVATATGPTCGHELLRNPQWFPADWAKMGEAARLAWMLKRQKENKA